jgi:hypothetical protein
MSNASSSQTHPLPAELRARLEADLRFQQESGTALLRFAIGVALVTTAFAAWLGMGASGTAPTLIPIFVAAAVGVIAIVVAVVHRRLRTASLRAVLASAQVIVVEGHLDAAQVLPATGGHGHAYLVDGRSCPVVEESPGSEELLGFVAHQIVGPAVGTPVRLVFNAVRPGHLLQVEYPTLHAQAVEATPMVSRDWKHLMARPRALLQAAAWWCGAMVLALVVLAFLPGVSRGFSAWLGIGLVVMMLWVVLLCLPALRMWGQRKQVMRETVSGPIQEVMQARTRRGRQGVESARFVRVGGRWYRQSIAGSHTDKVPPSPGNELLLAYATLGLRRVSLQTSATSH